MLLSEECVGSSAADVFVGLEWYNNPNALACVVLETRLVMAAKQIWFL